MTFTTRNALWYTIGMNYDMHERNLPIQPAKDCNGYA